MNPDLTPEFAKWADGEMDRRHWSEKTKYTALDVLEFAAAAWRARLSEARPAPDRDLIEALKHIAEPVAWEQAHLKEGYVIEWPMLLHMLKDPEYYKRIAREALSGHST